MADPFGDTPQAGPGDKLRGNVTPSSGFAVTAGGLVLFVDKWKQLYVLDEKTGQVIHTRDMPK